MPFSSEIIKIEGTKFDRRVKVTPEMKVEIKRLRSKGFTQSEVASQFNISRRTIQFIENPQALVENKKRREERGGWRQYYDKKYNTVKVRNTRRYKHKLYIEGKITMPGWSVTVHRRVTRANNGGANGIKRLFNR